MIMVMMLAIIRDPSGENYHQTCANPTGINKPVVSNKLVEEVNLQSLQSLDTIENHGWKFHYFVCTEFPMNQHLRIKIFHYQKRRNEKCKFNLSQYFYYFFCHDINTDSEVISSIIQFLLKSRKIHGTVFRLPRRKMGISC